MTSFTRVMVATLVGLAGTLYSAPALSELPETPQRVIYLLLDTLGAKHLSYMGYERETSPFLDELAAESANFTFCISHGDGTVYAMPAIFASKYYSQLYLDPPFVAGLPPSTVTLAELFQAAGFHTIGWSTNPHITTRTRYHQGFDSYYDMLPTGAVYSRIEHVIRKVRRTYKSTGGREFVYVHLMDVHSPYFPPAPYHSMWAKPYDREEFVDGRMLNRLGMESFGIQPYWAESHNVTQEDIDQLVSQYDGEIRYLNDYLPELLEALRYNPATDMVVVTADHGEQFYENGFLGHNRSNSMAEIHVPLLIRHPGLDPVKVDTPVGTKDIYVTLCDIFGFDVPEGAMGRSLLPAMRGETLEEEPLYTEAAPSRGPAAAVLHEGTYYYLNTEAHRRLRPWLRWPIREVLFDFDSDPTLQADIASERPELRASMNEILRQLSPRFEAATPELLAGTAADLLLGPELLQQGERDGAMLLDGEKRQGVRQLVKEVVVDRPLLLTFQYVLTGEAPQLRLRAMRENKTPFYDYHFFKRRKAPRSFEVVIFPDTDTFRVRFDLLGNGRAIIQDLSLRELTVPKIPVKPWPGAEEFIDTESEALTEEELERMEALGYLN